MEGKFLKTPFSSDLFTLEQQIYLYSILELAEVDYQFLYKLVNNKNFGQDAHGPAPYEHHAILGI